LCLCVSEFVCAHVGVRKKELIKPYL